MTDNNLVERLRAYGGDDERDYRHLAASRIEALEAERDETERMSIHWLEAYRDSDDQCRALQARLDQAVEALRRVADLDIVEASLDPGWFRRHARTALTSLEAKP